MRTPWSQPSDRPLKDQRMASLLFRLAGEKPLPAWFPDQGGLDFRAIVGQLFAQDHKLE